MNKKKQKNKKKKLKKQVLINLKQPTNNKAIKTLPQQSFFKKWMDNFLTKSPKEVIHQIQKSKSIKYISIGLVSFLTLLVFAQYYTGSIEKQETQIRDIYIENVLKKEKISNWSVIHNFTIDYQRVGFYSYQKSDGFYFTLYNVSKNKEIKTEKLEVGRGQEFSNNHLIVLGQLLMYLENQHIQIKNFEFEDGNWVINNKVYKVETRYSQLISVNNTDIYPFINVYFTQTAMQRIFKKYEVDWKSLQIGSISTIDNPKDKNNKIVQITCRPKDKKELYWIQVNMNGEVEITKTLIQENKSLLEGEK